jgi:two-component system, LuxR family, response regulator FixJ
MKHKLIELGSTVMLQNGGLSSEIFIVDDDEMVRDLLSPVFIEAGYQVMTFSEGTSFVAAARVRVPACILMDISMPGLSGLDVLKQIDAANYPAPICIVSGRGDIPVVVEAIKNGASDFIEKQMDADSIVERVGKAIAAWARRQPKEETPEMRWRRFPGRDNLTRREIDVLAQITACASNKVAAKNLGISPRTIEIHRKNIMKKLCAQNVVHLVHIVLSSNGGAEQTHELTYNKRSDYADIA